jgi:apolipoprotein D and lipocalin family protein
MIKGLLLTIAVLAGAAGLQAGLRGDAPLETGARVDLDRYMGTWFEIAAFPQRFEKGCHCTTAEYTMTDRGYVRVVNTCRKGGPDGKLNKARGKAFVVAGSGNAKLRVQFFWPFRGDYWIIDLAEDYSYAVVGAPNRKYLWILARTARMDPGLYDQIVKRAAAKGFDMSKLMPADQSCF